MEARQPLMWTCMLVALVSIPLVTKLIGINPVYGVRTSHTMSSASAWYAVNAYVGWTFLVAAGAAAVLLWLMPGASRWPVAVVVFVVPMAIALALSLTHAGRVG